MSNLYKQVSDNTENIIKKELVKGYEDGEGSYDIAQRLEKSTGFSYKRCEAIARTEIMGSCNYADYISYMQNESIIGMELSRCTSFQYAVIDMGMC